MCPPIVAAQILEILPFFARTRIYTCRWEGAEHADRAA
jgi:hypothetical protein